MNFHGLGSPPSVHEEQPTLTFFNHARGLADRETLPIDENGNDPRFSRSFEAAISNSRRTWVIDSYISDEPDLAEELFTVMAVFDVIDARVITSARDRYGELMDKVSWWNNETRRKGRINLRCLPSRAGGPLALPHDRFAIVDSELWHWGATIGGGYSGQNACSRGWSASRTRAAYWFEQLWNYAK